MEAHISATPSCIRFYPICTSTDSDYSRTIIQFNVTSFPQLLRRLTAALYDRRVVEGIRALEKAGEALAQINSASPDAAALVLCIAQWVDMGYRDHALIEQLLACFSLAQRGRLPLEDYLLLRLAEACRAMMVEDADTAIDLIDFVLRAEDAPIDTQVLATAHFWKGRSHRKKGEYELALRHIVKARSLAVETKATKLAAVIQIQESWLLFQKGLSTEALRLLDHAEAELKGTDDAVSLGNIESARGRIVRRTGEYAEALIHYDRAIAIYAQRNPHHRNLARTLVNAAYVKRLIALQLSKRIDSRAAQLKKTLRWKAATGTAPKHSNYRARHTQVCKEALELLRQAGKIYSLQGHHGGIGSVLVNSGYLHLDSGDIDRAASEALKAYEHAHPHHDLILMARARTLQASAENTRVDEQLGEDADTAVYANRARRYAEEAVALAQQTQNSRLLAGAYIVRGMTAVNDLFQEWDVAKQCLDRAAALLRPDDRDHLWEELIVLKSCILRASGIDETLRAWSEGMVGNRTFQQITEDFAEIVIPKVWLHEGKRTSRVVERLSISPKKVRRILRSAGLSGQDAE
jgi:tetratricopeptide (TPR) repeat protein